MLKMIGLTILEFMLSIALGSLIAFCLLKIALYMEKNNETQFAILQLQENITTARFQLTSSVHSAGFLLCNPFETNEKPLQLYQHKEIKKGTQGIMISSISLNHSLLAKPMQNNTTLYINGNETYLPGEKIVISNCIDNEVAQIKQVTQLTHHMQKILLQTPLQNRYQPYSELSVIQSRAFFIGKTERITSEGDPIFALYLLNEKGIKSEIVEGMDDLQITATINQAGSLLDIPAEKVSDWKHVCGITFKCTFSALNHLPYKKTLYFYAAYY